MKIRIAILILFMISFTALSCRETGDMGEDKLANTTVSVEHTEVFQPMTETEATQETGEIIPTIDGQLLDESYPFTEKGWYLSDISIENKTALDYDMSEIGRLIKSGDDVVYGKKTIGDGECYNIVERSGTELIIGYDGGEHGGGITYLEFYLDEFMENEEYNTYLITYGSPIWKLIEYMGDIYYISGHPFGMKGGIGKLDIINTKWTSLYVKEFNASITSYLVDDYIYFLKGSLYKLKDDEIEELFVINDHSNIGAIYDKEFVKKGNIIYLATEYGIVSYNAMTEEILWWVK